MTNRLVKGTRITEFRLKQLLKHKPVVIARKLIGIYEDKAEDMVMTYLPDSYQKEVFLQELRNQTKAVEVRKWNRGNI